MSACHSFYNHSVTTDVKGTTNLYKTDAKYKNGTELTQYTATILHLNVKTDC